MTTKIDLAEKSKVVDFKKDIFEQLNNFRDERVILERNEFYSNLIRESEESEEDTDYDDGSEVTDYDYEEIDSDLEADILKEFGDDLGN